MTNRRIDLPADYREWLADLKVRIREVNQRASLTLNVEPIGLY